MKSGEPEDQDLQAQRIAYLIAGFIRETLTVAEHDELDGWIDESDANMQLFEELTDEKNIEENLAWMQKLPTDNALRKTKEAIGFPPTPKRKTTIYLRPYLVAASIIMLMLVTYFFLNRSVKEGKHDPAQIEIVHTDVEPGGNKATLTLSDGRTIDLDGSTVGALETEAGSEVNKSGEGELVYSQAGNVVQEAVYHTLTTPRGGQYMLTLSDGTKVWLNAASSIYFPARFTGSERMVKITGEAYFEVAKDKAKPFIVQLPDNNKVKVLGTHFVASSYDNEASQYITLEEGSVEVTNSAGSSITLQPSQQASMTHSSLSVNKDVDMEAALGWVRGDFVFHNADIRTIMRQVERWYDVNIVYRSSTSEHFNATIGRNVSVSKLLHLLELTGKIKFTITNNTIHVLP